MNFKLYVGLSPYWVAAKDLDEMSAYWHKRYSRLYKRALFTYFASRDFEKWKKFISFRTGKISLMFDSGAFSVWKAGEGDVDLEALIDYNLKLQEEHSFKSIVFISLDKIPGTLERAANHAEVLEAARVSLRNYLRMKERGLKVVLPVYHLGEPLSCLKEILDNDVGYVGLGGLARGAADKARRAWLDSVFSFLAKYPEIKTHGFGVTSPSLVLRYPWYSVDSVSPRFSPGYGFVEIFDEKRHTVRRVYIQGIRPDARPVSKTEKKYLAEYFGIEYKDLKCLWCRVFFSQREWMRFEKFVKKQRKVGVKKALQQSLLGGLK